MDAIAELIGQEQADDPPEGFLRVPDIPGFNLLLGAIYARVHEGRLILGMRIKQHLLNPHNTLHGGVTACFVDLQAYVAQRDGGVPDHVTPTVSLSVDYLEPISNGEWLVAHTSLLKATRNLLFTTTIGKVDDKVVFRANCIFKIGPKAAQSSSTYANMFKSLETMTS